ncbi:MAG: BON domain-containing protein [Myxococcales bacterium]|nr:BON domain-containing protein [Myxococcales bacterium]
MRDLCLRCCALLAALLLATPALADRPADAMLATWVREALEADPRIDAKSVEVATEKGIVTLRGSVPTLAGKRYGILTAQRIRGVLGVIDQVDVESAPRPDADLVRTVERRIQRSAALAGGKIGVVAKSSRVTLSGQVRSWSQRLHAELVASEVRGVEALDNQLVVQAGTQRPDSEVKSDVDAALARDAFLVGLPIRAAVERGKVTLSGAVSSAYEKTRAGTQVGSVSNVRGVENRIQVEWWPDRSARVAVPDADDDAGLTQAIREELAQDDRIDASGIEASIASGRVLLRGSVPSERQRRLAEEDARNLVGVAWVTNELRVAAIAREDAEIKGELEEVLTGDSALFEYAIAVAVHKGTVTLEGDVGSGYHRAHAAAIASRTRGVQEVENRLRTMAVAIAADEVLSREIVRRLERDWRTGAVMSRLNVEVQDGVVTLSGDVNRFAERRAAERIARRTPGVRRVRNEIIVDRYPYPWEEHLEDDEPVLPDWDPHWDFPDWPWIV